MTSSPSAALLDTVVTLIVRDGLEAVSVRRVAAAAGVSIGAVQHHFPTKDAMLLAAMDLVATHGTRLLDRIVAAHPPAEALRSSVHLLAGLEPGGRDGTAVWLAFVARACSDATVAARHARRWAQAETLFAQLLVAADATDETGSRDRAAELLALVDGVAVALAVEPARMPAERARHVLDTAVDRLLSRGG